MPKAPSNINNIPPLPPRSKPILAIVLTCLALVFGLLIFFFGNHISRGVEGSVEASFNGEWNQIEIKANFQKISLFGENQLNHAGVTYEVLTSNGKVLYQGTSHIASVDDTLLASDESLTVKACVVLQKTITKKEDVDCVQTALAASTKKYVSLTNVVHNNSRDVPNIIEISFEHELQRLVDKEKNVWRALQKVDSPIFLDVWVGTDIERRVRTQTHTSNSLKEVRLSEGEGYQSFVSAFQSGAKNNPVVELNFQFVFFDKNEAVRYPILQQKIQTKTDEERLDDARKFMRSAAERVIFETYFGNNDLKVIVTDFKHDWSNRRYSLIGQVEWTGGITGQYAVTGKLDVNEDGTNPRFEVTSEGNAVRHINNWPMPLSNAVLILSQDSGHYQIRIREVSLFGKDVYCSISRVKVDRSTGWVSVYFNYRDQEVQLRFSQSGTPSMKVNGNYTAVIPILGRSTIQMEMIFSNDGSAKGSWSNAGFSEAFDIQRKN